MTRFVLWNDDNGLYLGNCFGMGFWTKLDPVGQDTAVTFPSAEDALQHASRWESQLPVVARPIDITSTYPSTYASIADCVRAGLPAWDPEACFNAHV